jgi:hypothetical protein
MSWNDRRKGWFGRPPKSPEPAAESNEQTSITIPPFPTFSPAAIAQMFSTSRQHVHYWMQSGKLEYFRDVVGDCYVLREELIRFAAHYSRGRWSKNQQRRED